MSSQCGPRPHISVCVFRAPLGPYDLDRSSLHTANSGQVREHRTGGVAQISRTPCAFLNAASFPKHAFWLGRYSSAVIAMCRQGYGASQPNGSSFPLTGRPGTDYTAVVTIGSITCPPASPRTAASHQRRPGSMHMHANVSAQWSSKNLSARSARSSTQVCSAICMLLTARCMPGAQLRV